MDRWLEDWDGMPFRKPDKIDQWPGHFEAVWYGVDRRRATMVELSSETYIVTEYTHISEWFIDEPWEPEEHGDYYDLQVAEFAPAFIRKTAWELGEGIDRTPAGRGKFFRTPTDAARWAAGIGAAYISYNGGTEDTAETLP